MNKCFNCNKKTKNPKFCSRACAAILNNKLIPKRKKIFNICSCGKQAKHRSKYCKTCTPNKDWSLVTYRELTGIRKYQKNSRIRSLARSVYSKSNKPKQCAICGYKLHFEVCHKKAICSFPDTTTIMEINNINNLIALCPTHHWEFDNSPMSNFTK